MRPCLDSANFGIDTELEKLRNDRMKMKMEIMKLKQQQENTECYLAAVKERIGYTECKQQDIPIFMAKAFSNPAFSYQFIHLMRLKKELYNDQIAKKQRLVAASQSKEDQVTNKNQEELTTKHSEVERLFFALLDDESSPSQDQKINAAPGPMTPDLISDNYISWEKLLEDGLICENGSAQVEAELVQHQSKIVLQLENLIAKPPDWASYVKDLGEQVSCLESK
ncbi:Heat shock factor protein HSF30 [Camellia lanceoleosa]|uniref:Heat shock factor protein HSF30 n=1 Tax=Camellia lanceoleosa TaxID=1840588 RepID=A0ACC0ICX0_9ERIC|nr:Heat shock factor protein HSF30 [Camellia lanceoleosa]